MPHARRLTIIVAALLAVLPATAHAATVTSGKLDWTMANLYASGDPARTWLGYGTNPTGPGASNGSVTPGGAATLTDPAGAAAATVDGSSPRGADKLFTLGYPGASGTWDETGEGAIALTGTFTFVTHNLPITITDPLITLHGLTGTLSASGTDAGGQAYGRDKPQFTLDLANATVSQRADGAKVIAGIVPAATNDTALSGFGPGARLYGTMKLTLALAPATPQAGIQGIQGPMGPAGPQGPAGKNGANGKSAKLATIKLKRAPFASAKTLKVRLLARRTGKLVATGTVYRRTLRLAYLQGTKLKGKFVLRRTNTHRQAVITLR